MTRDPNDKSCRDLLRLAMPLMLGMSGFMIMQFMDAMFLAWHSPEALAAIGPAGLASFLLVCLFQGVAGYAGTFAAQYIGAGRPRRAGAAIWQGIYVALVSAVFVACAAQAGPALFYGAGHTGMLARMEIAFFRIACWGALPGLLVSAFSGLFTATERTRSLMIVQLVGLVWNGVAAWLLVLGHGGFPRLGITGAALAMVSAQSVNALLLAWLFFRARERRDYGTWSERRLDWTLFGRLLRFGVPSGARMAVEILAWTVFMFFVGRVGTADLAATNIAWRINGASFFPLIGMAQAVSVYVGQCQGRGRPDLSRRIVYRGLAMSEAWMLICGAFFVFLPGPLIRLFFEAGAMSNSEQASLFGLSVMMLRFVAAYSFLDACNVVVLSALQSAGDTRWTFAANLVAYGLFIGALILFARLHAGIVAQWWLITVFVLLVALTWLLRFASGRWRNIRVIEPLAP